MNNDSKILIRIAGLIIILGFGYMFAITFLNIPASNREIMNNIISFINSAIMLILGFYWGNSKKNNIDLETKSATISKEDDLTINNTKGSEITTQESQETNP